MEKWLLYASKVQAARSAGISDKVYWIMPLKASFSKKQHLEVNIWHKLMHKLIHECVQYMYLYVKFWIAESLILKAVKIIYSL